MGDFTEKPDYYTVKLVAEIEGFEPDQYGNVWYNVLFEGDAETFMWLAKNPPEEGKQYYGHFEPTKSGKRIRFKTDKLPEGLKPAPSADNKYLKDVTDLPVRFMLALLQYYDVQTLAKNSTQYENYVETVRLFTEEALTMIENLRGESRVSPSPRLKDGVDPPVNRAATGYDKFKQMGDKVKDEGYPDNPFND